MTKTTETMGMWTLDMLAVIHRYCVQWNNDGVDCATDLELDLRKWLSDQQYSIGDVEGIVALFKSKERYDLSDAAFIEEMRETCHKMTE